MLNTSEFFGGTNGYYRIAQNALLTDGTKYVADEAGAYWLFQDTAIYLIGYQTQDEFQTISLENHGEGFMVKASDGNGHDRILFRGEFTDFPDEDMPFKFFAQFSYEVNAWVFMLPCEY